MKVLIVGSGGREHALAWRLGRSASVSELHAAPGNPGLVAAGVACHPVHPEDADGLRELARALDIELVVIGPEAPLVAGVADELRRGGLAVFGPGREAARIEGSKAFAKDVMAAAGVPAALTLAVARPPCVVKVDGLAAGKGVFVCRTQKELDAALPEAAAFGGPLVIEELLEGEEISVFALSDGAHAIALPAAQDYKRAYDGDAGPNTGGMGTYAPVRGFGPAELEEILDTVHRPVIAELARRGSPFSGVLFAGLMLTESGPRVLELIARFGDPETQSLLPLVEGDLGEALLAAAAGGIRHVDLACSDEAAVTVVLAAGDYPAQGDAGSPIDGIEAAQETGALVFHAGTALRDGRVVTAGGRILGVTATGETLEAARSSAYAAADLISFDGMRYRTDIAGEASRV